MRRCYSRVKKSAILLPDSYHTAKCERSSRMRPTTASPIVPIPAVNGIVMNDRGEVLLTRRSPLVRESGKWCLPGGHLELGEDWATAVIREIREEVGLESRALKLVGL